MTAERITDQLSEGDKRDSLALANHSLESAEFLPSTVICTIAQFSLTLAIVVGFWLAPADLAAGISTVSISYCFFFVSTMLGEVIWHRHLNSRFHGALPEKFALGFILLTSLLLLVTIFSPNISLSWILTTTLVGVISLRQLLRSGTWTHFDWLQLKRALRIGSLGDWAVVICAVAAASVWTQENRETYQVTEQTVRIVPWLDVFIHAKFVAIFGHAPNTSSLIDYDSAGTRLPPYHYATFIFPSLLVRFCGVDALAATCRLMFPLGILLSIFGASALGRAIVSAWNQSWGRNNIGGVCAAVALGFLPDAFGQHLGNGWTSYHFFQQVAPGGGYACTALALAWVFLLSQISDNRHSALISKLILSCTCLIIAALFKFNVSYVFAASLLITSAFLARSIAVPGRFLALIAGVLTYWGFSQLPRYIATAPSLWFDGSGRFLLLQLILSNFATTSTDTQTLATAASWNSWLVHALEQMREFLWGAPVLVTTMYGVLGFLVPVIALSLIPKASQCRNRLVVIAIPILVMLNHLLFALALTANQGMGDPMEFNHKTFIFGYFTIATWFGALMSLAGANLFFRKQPAVRALTFTVGIPVFALLLFYSAKSGSHIQREAFSGNLVATEVPRGLFESAQFVRNHATTADTVQYSKNDTFGVLPAIAERATYLRLPIVNGKVLVPEQLKLRELALNKALSAVDARAQLAELGIQWIIVDPQDEFEWANLDRATPAFTAQGFRVFATNRR